MKSTNIRIRWLRATLFTISMALISLHMQAQSQVKVLQLNIWQEGTKVKEGYKGIVSLIRQLKPDLITLSEVRNYNNTKLYERLIADLKAGGLVYYGFSSYDSGMLSASPIKSYKTVFPESQDQGSLYQLVTELHGREIALYTAHLDYTYYANYLPRGYDGFSWKKLKMPVLDVDSIIAYSLKSKRMEAINAFLKSAAQDRAKGRIVILGGDFNEASHADWTAATARLYDHQNLIIPWPVSTALARAGYIDSYRKLYPNAATHPGFTFPADNPLAEVSQLTWTPDADERERIDFIYYHPHPALKLLESYVLGPRGSIMRNSRQNENTEDHFLTLKSPWPSDHKGVWSIFQLKAK